MEISWILSCFTSKGLLNRAHAYKAVTSANEEKGKDPDYRVNVGLYSYPVLMAADILSFDADYVPVGEDQLQHIEIARDISQCINSNYKKELLKSPEGMVRKELGTILGLDGRKMSKSYQNVIPLFVAEKRLKKLINKITTDSTPPEEPKNPEESMIFDFYKLFATKNEVDSLRKSYESGISWGEAKASLFEVANREFSPMREKFDSLMSNPEKIEEVLSDGAKKVRVKAKEVLSRLKEAIGCYGY